MNQIMSFFKGLLAWIILFIILKLIIPDSFREHPRLYSTVSMLIIFLALFVVVRIGQWVTRVNEAVNKSFELFGIVKKIDQDLANLEDKFIFFNTFERLNRLESSFFIRLKELEEKQEKLEIAIKRRSD